MRVYVPGHASDAEAAPQLASFYGTELLSRDVPPLLPGLDKGPGNPLDQARRMAAEAWGARRTWFLTNGASQGNRMAALALASFRGAADRVVTQRSAHSSFIDGIVLGGLHPEFVVPSIDTRLGINHGISGVALEHTLAGVTAPKGVYVISPSYFGAVADVKRLAELAHEAGAPLIVDAAWGAHFGFSPELPVNPLALGADLVISSTHKLGGSLTQSAMLHLAHGPFADELEPLIERAFSLTQSTSASSLLLASLDLARDTLENGTAQIAASIAAADELRARVRAIGRFGIVSDTFGAFGDIVDSDPLRVSIDVSKGGLRGHTVRDSLERQGISFEISTDSCVVAVLGAGMVPDVERIVDALHAFEPEPEASVDGDAVAVALPAAGELAMQPREAFLARSETVGLDAAVGRISSDALAAYPPGIPNVLPGEVITHEVVDFLRRVSSAPGGYVRGAMDAELTRLRVVSARPPEHGHGRPASRSRRTALHQGALV